MTCRYCGTAHPEAVTRCRKCNASLDAPEPRPRSGGGRSAAALRELPQRGAWTEPLHEQPPARRAPYQPSLFSSPEAPKVVAIRGEGEGRTRGGHRGSQARGGGSAAPHAEQRQMALPETVAARRRRHQDGVVSCNAPVAGPLHRVLAFLIDFSLVAIASGAAIIGVALWGGVELPGRSATLACGGGLVLSWLLYQLLWILADGDSPGMTWTRLRCLDLNGYRPRMRQRFLRLGMTCLGALAAGLGLAWALVDEEGLAWQDHVSESFPSPF